VRIYDLACDLIKLSGLRPEKDIKIEFTGIRPGEKLSEELRLSSENFDTTTHSKIFICRGRKPDVRQVEADLRILKKITDNEDEYEAEEFLLSITRAYTQIKRKSG
jgi:FlaA1/EpsC-like NDP-sugar epimerase